MLLLIQTFKTTKILIKSFKAAEFDVFSKLRSKKSNKEWKNLETRMDTHTIILSFHMCPLFATTGLWLSGAFVWGQVMSADLNYRPCPHTFFLGLWFYGSLPFATYQTCHRRWRNLFFFELWTNPRANN